MRHTQRPLPNAYCIWNSVWCVSIHPAMDLENIGLVFLCMPTQNQNVAGVAHTSDGVESEFNICSRYGRQSTCQATKIYGLQGNMRCSEA